MSIDILRFVRGVLTTPAALGLSSSANVLLRAAPAFLLYFAAADHPITAR
jgi:CTP:molybdopterin cytidylyltransferase MocA